VRHESVSRNAPLARAAAASLLLLGFAASVAGQAPAPAEARFEAATIKPVSDMLPGRGPSGPGLFSRNYIILHQLKVNSSRAQVEVLVIDSAQRPSAD
jgi:hypothetical protein